MRKIIVFLATAMTAVVFSWGALCAQRAFGEKSPSLVIVGEKSTYVYTYPQLKFEMGECRLTKLNEEIDKICQSELVACKNARIKFSPEAKIKFSILAEADGQEVDRERLKDDIISCLSVGGGCVKPVYKPVKPTIYKKDLSIDVHERAKFSTDFSTSSAERKSNIALAAKAINGTILDAGEEFSFNDTVGKRSEQRGYKNAKIISDGNFVEGVGGGVCQVSTTLYNAALLSGLTVTEYHPHTLAVSYVKSSFDAMVSYGSCDLKFKNTTDSPVYIRAACNSGELTVTVYGKKLDCVYERESVVDQTIKPKILKTLDQSLSEGEYVVVTHPKDGVKSCGYLIKKQNGKVVWRKLIRKDSYKAVDGVIKVGSDNAYPDKPLG